MRGRRSDTDFKNRKIALHDLIPNTKLAKSLAENTKLRLKFLYITDKIIY